MFLVTVSIDTGAPSHGWPPDEVMAQLQSERAATKAPTGVCAVTVKRDLSTKTWNNLDLLIAKIRQRAANLGDQDIYADADRASLLLRNLSNEICIEDGLENAN